MKASIHHANAVWRVRNPYGQPHPQPAVESAAVYPLFDFVFDGLRRSGAIDPFRVADGRLPLALDGTQYFSPAKIHGPCCSCKTHGNGKTSYSHTVATPVLVKPGSDKAIPLAPEFIRPQET